MADTKSAGSFLAKFVAVVLCLGIAALGTWMIIDPTGFQEGGGPNATGVTAQAKYLKDALKFATDSIGIAPTGGILAAVGLGAMWLVMRPTPKH